MTQDAARPRPRPRRRRGRHGSLLLGGLVAAGLCAGCVHVGSDSASPPASAPAGADLGGGPCPSHLVIQTDWFPEVEHGGAYQLIGSGGQADKSTMRYSGPLQPRYRGAHGVRTVEIRIGYNG